VTEDHLHIKQIRASGSDSLLARAALQVTEICRVSVLSCSGLVTTPAEVVEEGSGFGGDAGLGGHLLGADGDSG
jgi:hypothetical protein